MTFIHDSVNLSAMSSLGKLLKESFSFALRLIRQQAGPLFLLLLISCAINLTVQAAMPENSRVQDGANVGLLIVLGIWSLIETIVMFLILSWGVPSVRPPTAATVLKEPFREAYLSSFVAEYFRTLAQVLLYGLLLIIPGFIRYARLIFVPYIAIFSKDYRADQVDALKLSEQMSAKVFGRIVGAILILIAIDAGLSSVKLIDKSSFLLSVLSLVFTFLVSVWGYALMFQMFEESMENSTEN